MADPALDIHHPPSGVSDRFALAVTKFLRFCADTFFAKRYGHRAIVLETVAAVPGMVAATLTHLRCLRQMTDDKGWIHILLDEAENERMHLMTFVAIAKPTLFERIVILTAQWVFYVFFFFLYLARAYWKELPADATLRDVVLVVRNDEAHHRDVNHGFAAELAA